MLRSWSSQNRLLLCLSIIQLIGSIVSGVHYALLSSSKSVSTQPPSTINVMSLYVLLQYQSFFCQLKLFRCAMVDCSAHGACLQCSFPKTCAYGEFVTVNCTTNSVCSRQLTIRREEECKFCWQTAEHEHECVRPRNCSTIDPRPQRTTCVVRPHVVCIGRREFYKNVRCDWQNGYTWSTALFLSVTLGGFGADRFYLGLWKSAIGKMFCFGGLGIWTLVDIVLIAIGYLGPHDGSHYV